MNKKEKEIIEVDGYKTLPRTRKEVFFDLLAHRKMNMFSLSSLTFLFFVPLVIDLFFFNYFELLAIANDNLEHLFSMVFYSMILMLPCMIIGFIGLGGAFYVAKKMVWQEMVSATNDFLKGIKETWKHSIINGLIFGVSLFGLVVGGTFLWIYSPTEQVISGIGIGALIVLYITLGIVLSLFYTQDVYYSNPYRITFKNAFSFLGLTNWKVFLLFILSTGVVTALCCINTITLTIGIVLFAVFNFVVIILYTLISHAAFDKYINLEHYPDMVNKGLYKEKVSSSVEESKEA